MNLVRPITLILFEQVSVFDYLKFRIYNSKLEY